MWPHRVPDELCLPKSSAILTRMLRLLTFFLLVLLTGCSSPPSYDMAIVNGRVMDPESGLDAVRNVGVNGDKIATITEHEISGKQTLDAAGHVVTAGFIDFHRHGHSPENYRAQIHDGITSALELEIGVEDIDAFYAEREGKALVNHGATISHPYTRNIVMTGANPGLEGDALLRALTPDQLDKLKDRIARGLDQGAVGIGFHLADNPGATSNELLELFRLAPRYDATCFVHIRTSRTDTSNVEEALGYSKETGAPLHIVHINSSGAAMIPEYLDVIQKARDNGVDVTTECYPYNRGSTLIQSHQLNDWETYSDDELAQYNWVETGEQLTRESFGKYRKQGGFVISPPSYSLENVKAAVASPLTMIASDGTWLVNGRAHPRTFGAYARVLGRYVREEKALSLMDALAKMSLRPAKRLQRRVPMMKNKGRVKVGADADLVVFNPDTVLDKGTFEDPAQYPEGIRHVVVNGAAVLVEGNLVEGKLPGRPIRAPASARGGAIPHD